MNTTIYILLGSNLGDRDAYISSARKKIEEKAGTISLASSIYKTQAWGKVDQPDFLNQVVRVTSGLSPLNLLHSLLKIEEALGRKRFVKWGERIIDIDILFYGHEVINTPELIIPHPGITQRRFTLVPLCEIAPSFIHPLAGKSCETLLKECSDPSVVEVFLKD